MFAEVSIMLSGRTLSKFYGAFSADGQSAADKPELFAINGHDATHMLRQTTSAGPEDQTSRQLTVSG